MTQPFWNISDNHSSIDFHNAVTYFNKRRPDNHLQISSKTKELLLSCYSPQNPTTINTITVETAVTFKYLGITLDNKVNFNRHTTDILKKKTTKTAKPPTTSKTTFHIPPSVAIVYQRIQPSICTVPHVSFICILSTGVNSNTSQAHLLKPSVSPHRCSQNKITISLFFLQKP